jgi:hypothetical protein
MSANFDPAKASRSFKKTTKAPSDKDIQIYSAKQCIKAEQILAQYGAAVREEWVDKWRVDYINARRLCKNADLPREDCNFEEVAGLIEVFNGMRMAGKNGGGSGKMVGGGYAELVAQLSALAEWLRGHATNISNCAKWFLEKIWEAAKVAARAGAHVANLGATTISSFATTTPAVLYDIGAATGQATGITDMLALLESVINLGDVVISDMYNTAIGGDKTTATYMIAVAALHFVIDPVNAAIAPYGAVMNYYINQVTVANMDAIGRATGMVVITPLQLTQWLDATPWYDKIYTLIVAGKIIQIAPTLASGLFTTAGLALNAGLYFAPFAVLIAQSRFFTIVLLSHATFRTLSPANQAIVLNMGNKLDTYLGNKIETERVAQLNELNEVVKNTLTNDDLQHYIKTVGLKQQIARANADAGGIEKLIKFDTAEQELVRQVDAARKTVTDLEAVLASRRGPAQSFLACRGGGGGGGGAGAGSSSAYDPMNKMEMEMEKGGNRSTRKRGSNKKGGAKSKCSPKSTRKGGRKQSVRKRR